MHQITSQLLCCDVSAALQRLISRKPVGGPKICHSSHLLAHKPGITHQYRASGYGVGLYYNTVIK